MWPGLRLLYSILWSGLRLLFLIVAWLTFNYIWRPFTHTSTPDWYSSDKHISYLAAWFVSIQERIVLLRALERLDTPTLGRHTQSMVIGRQRGSQRALGVHVPLWVCARIRTRARDSTHRERLLGWVCVRWVMCLDTACVSKSTVSVAGCSVSIWRRTGVSAMGTYRWHRREKCR